MADEKVVFGNCWDALASALGDRLDPSMQAALAEMGIDLKKLHAAYPHALWIRSLELAMERLSPGLPLDEATYRMGRAMYERYGQTIVGKALLQVLAVLGPRRALERLERNFRTTNNYSRTQLIQLAPNRYEVELSDVHFPHYYRGVLDAGLERSAKNPQVTLLSHEPDGPARFAVSWD